MARRLRKLFYSPDFDGQVRQLLHMKNWTITRYMFRGVFPSMALSTSCVRTPIAGVLRIGRGPEPVSTTINLNIYAQREFVSYNKPSGASLGGNLCLLHFCSQK